VNELWSILAAWQWAVGRTPPRNVLTLCHIESLVDHCTDPISLNVLEKPVILSCVHAINEQSLAASIASRLPCSAPCANNPSSSTAAPSRSRKWWRWPSASRAPLETTVVGRGERFDAILVLKVLSTQCEIHGLIPTSQTMRGSRYSHGVSSQLASTSCTSQLLLYQLWLLCWRDWQIWYRVH
jgi:hypothetical protein